MTHDYDNDGFGGSPNTSNAFEQAKREESASYDRLYNNSRIAELTAQLADRDALIVRQGEKLDYIRGHFKWMPDTFGISLPKESQEVLKGICQRGLEFIGDKES